MSLPTTGIGFSPTTPAADAGFQNAKPRGDSGTPLEKFSFEVPNTGIASVKSANYTAVAADCGKLLSFADSSPATGHTLTLPSTPPFAQWRISVQNTGTSTLTIGRNGKTIDGATTNPTLAQGSGIEIFTDGTNYFTERGSGIALPLTGAFGVSSGATGTNVTGYGISPRAGSFTKCKVVVKSSDATVALTFTIRQNGTAVFSSAPTIAAGTAPGTLTTFTGLTSNPLPVAADDLFTMDITSGGATWAFTAQLE